MTRRQHFVTFMSPGSFCDESSTKPIESWDVKTAVAMAKKVSERYGSKPYGFRFSTSIVADKIPDGEGGFLDVTSKQVAESGTYFIDGRLRTGEEVLKDAKPSEDALRFNMRCNDIAIVCETANGWRHTGEFGEADSVVSSKTGELFKRGDDKQHVEYRKRWKKLCKEMRKWRSTYPPPSSGQPTTRPTRR